MPGHDAIGGLTRTVELSFIVAATVLLVVNVVRAFTSGMLLHWWAPLVVVIAACAADFVSGLVHWTADTWFSETMPVLGRRFLRPFRVHHVNPDDFLHRNFLDCNGDVAMLNTPILAGGAPRPGGDRRRGGAVARVDDVCGDLAADESGPSVGAHAGAATCRPPASTSRDHPERRRPRASS